MTSKLEDTFAFQLDAAANALYKYIAELTTRIAELEAEVAELDGQLKEAVQYEILAKIRAGEGSFTPLPTLPEEREDSE